MLQLNCYIQLYILIVICSSSIVTSQQSLIILPSQNVTVEDKCSTQSSHYSYKLIDNYNLVCLPLNCDKIKQIELNGECLDCPPTGCSCPPEEIRNRIVKNDQLQFECEKYQFEMRTVDPPCSISHLIASNGTCQCPEETHTEENGVCFATSEAISDENRNLFSRIDLFEHQFASKVLRNTLRPAIWGCNVRSNITACSYLLNLCTLKLATTFTVSERRNDVSNLCFFLERMNEKFVFQYPEEHLSAPLPVRFLSNDEVDILVLQYAFNGSLLQNQNIPLPALFHCWNSKFQHQSILFGQNLQKRCSWNIQELLKESQESTFYEFYLRLNQTSLIPIPVRLRNRKNPDQFWVLKRFFFTDSRIGVEDSTEKLWYLIYAKNVELEFKMSKTGILQPPFVSVEYEAIELSEKLPEKSIRSEFLLNFRMTESGLQLQFHLSVFLGLIVAIFWSLFKTWIWRQRSGFMRVNCVATVGIFAAKLCQSSANVILLINLFFLANRLFVFKYQKTVHSLLLSPEQETEVIIYISVAFLLKTVQILVRIFQITSIEIFFMDWEKPKKKLHSSNEHNGTHTDGRYKRAPGTQLETLSSALDQLHTPVTIWRSYFVANEWYELAKKRRVSLFAHICVVVMFLESSLWCRLMVKSTPMSHQPPETEALNEIATTRGGRLVFAGIVYGTLAFSQYFYQKYLKETCGVSKLNEFIDLCTVSNISVFCLLHRRYGFYLHGLAPNGRSEVNMMEMYEMLEMEESDLCTKRGLLANTEQQTFEMFLPREIHAQLRCLRKPVDSCQGAHPILSLFCSSASSSEHLRALSKEKLFQVYLSINRFLTTFIDHSYDRVDYMVAERSRWETMFGFEMDTYNMAAKLFNDNGNSIESVLFFGLEVSFIIFEMLSFVLIDLLIGGNFMLAGIGTATLSILVKHFYVQLARQNLVRKTLVDERFLI